MYAYFSVKYKKQIFFKLLNFQKLNETVRQTLQGDLVGVVMFALQLSVDVHEVVQASVHVCSAFLRSFSVYKKLR